MPDLLFVDLIAMLFWLSALRGSSGHVTHHLQLEGLIILIMQATLGTYTEANLSNIVRSHSSCCSQTHGAAPILP
jgi:hypothetical protein